MFMDLTMYMLCFNNDYIYFFYEYIHTFCSYLQVQSQIKFELDMCTALYKKKKNSPHCILTDHCHVCRLTWC